jgi:hypothetical protein
MRCGTRDASYRRRSGVVVTLLLRRGHRLRHDGRACLAPRKGLEVVADEIEIERLPVAIPAAFNAGASKHVVEVQLRTPGHRANHSTDMGLIVGLQSNCNLTAISDCHFYLYLLTKASILLDFMYFYGERGGTRTLDPMIKSHVLIARRAASGAKRPLASIGERSTPECLRSLEIDDQLKFVGNSTDRSPGLGPLRIFTT